MIITSERIKQYEKLNEINAYSELLVAVAQDFNLEKFKNIFKSILDIHLEVGHMYHDLSKFRYTMKNEMVECIIEGHGESEYNKISHLL